MSNRHLPPLAAQARLSTPLGPVTAAATHTGLAGLWFDGQAHHPGALDAPIDATHPHIACAQARLERYWRGDAVRFDDVPLDLHGTPFQRAVWQALRQIGRNPVSVIVPCHRVLGRNGALTGYAGGLERKQSLLQLEQNPACR
jgi:methylated-DNA-[protein]-cysteine S-methyltransferase